MHHIWILCTSTSSRNVIHKLSPLPVSASQCCNTRPHPPEAVMPGKRRSRPLVPMSRAMRCAKLLAVVQASPSPRGISQAGCQGNRPPSYPQAGQELRVPPVHAQKCTRRHAGVPHAESGQKHNGTIQATISSAGKPLSLPLPLPLPPRAQATPSPTHGPRCKAAYRTHSLLPLPPGSSRGHHHASPSRLITRPPPFRPWC